MYNEISFLFDTDITRKIQNNNNTTSIFPKSFRYEPVILRYKEKNPVSSTENTIKKFIQSKSYDELADGNPYSKIFGEGSPFIDNCPLKLMPQDFAYLRDLGVFPINRLVILRRFPEDTIVLNNLNDMDQKVVPISTIIGWIDISDDDMFSIKVNEEWTTETKLIHQVITDMIKNETGINIEKTITSPSWSEGFIYQFLVQMGLASEDVGLDKLSTNDPNFLRESSRRDIDGQSLKSTFNIDIKTSYEQKYINGIDPGSAFLDIFNNILQMGTSDMKFILSGDKVSGIAKAIIGGGIQEGDNRSEEYIKQWSIQIQSLIETFINTIDNMLGTVKEKAKNKELMEEIKRTAAGLLAGLILKYRWPLRGSLGIMTGIPTTPWHLTIGNPFNPIISMSNLLVDDVTIGWGNEIGFNDMPTIINVSVGLSLARSLGKNEIIEIFNNAYGRNYTTSANATKNVDNQLGPVYTDESYPETQINTIGKPSDAIYTGNVFTGDSPWSIKAGDPARRVETTRGGDIPWRQKVKTALKLTRIQWLGF